MEWGRRVSGVARVRRDRFLTVWSWVRPEILFPLFAPIESLKGVGDRVRPLLTRAAGPLVRDVLFLGPSGLVRRTVAKAASLVENEVQTLSITIESHRKPSRPGHPWVMRGFDDTGFVNVVFFKTWGDRLAEQHPVGTRRVVSGKVDRDFTGTVMQIVHPDYLLPIERGAEIPAIEAVYPATAGLPSRTIRRFAQAALARAPRPRRVAGRGVAGAGGLALVARGSRTLSRSTRGSRPLAPGPASSAAGLRRTGRAPVGPGRAQAGAARHAGDGGDAQRAVRNGAGRPALPSHRRPDAGGDGDRRRSRLGAAHDAAGAGRCRLGEDRGGHAGDDRRRRGRWPVRADGADRDPGASAFRDHPSADRSRRSARGPAHRSTERRGARRDTGRPGARRRSHCRRHPRGVPGRRRLSRPRPDRDRRAAPLRGFGAGPTPGEGRSGTPAGDVGDADPAHPGADPVRRSRRVAARREAARPHAGLDARDTVQPAGRSGDASEKRGGQGQPGVLDLPAGQRIRAVGCDRGGDTLAGPERGVRRQGRPGARPAAPGGEGRRDGAVRRRLTIRAGGDHGGRGWCRRAGGEHHDHRTGRALRPGPAPSVTGPRRARRGLEQLRPALRSTAVGDRPEAVGYPAPDR